LQVSAEGFTDAVFGAEVVREVIVNLVGDAEVAAVAGDGVLLGLGVAGDLGPEFAGDAEELGGF
jgi:hypothetical protein